MMTHDEERSARSNRSGEAGEKSSTKLRWQVHELRRDKVERVRFGCADEKVDLSPLNTRGRRRIRGSDALASSFDGDTGDVGCHYLPSPLCKPNRIRPLTAPDIERQTRREVGDLGKQLRIGIATPKMW